MKPSRVWSTQERVVKVESMANSIPVAGSSSFNSSVDCTLLHTIIPIPYNDAANIYGGAATPTQATPEIPAQAKQTPHPVAPEPPLTPLNSPTPINPGTQWSPAVQSTLDQPPAALPRRLILGGLCFVTLAVGWSWFGQIEEIGHAKGQMVPKGDVFKVHPTAMGKVAILAVDEGQSVEENQIVAELETTIEANEVERLKEALAADQIQLLQKEALLERIELEAGTQVEISAANIQAHEAAIAQTEAYERIARQLLDQLAIDVGASQTRVERLQPYVDQGAISQEYFFSAEQTLRDHQQSMTRQQGELEQSVAEIVRLRAELDQKRSESVRAHHEIEQQAQRLLVEITQLKADITEKERLLARAEAELSQRFLYAPVNGTVSSILVDNIGEVVQPGQTIAEITPEGAPLVLSAVLPDREAGFVEIGMPVQVKLDAYPFQEYGIISGQVTSISSDATVDETLGAVYQLKVELERNHVEEDGQIISFKAGQTADADIVIRKRRLIDVLLDPIRKLKKTGIDL